MSKGDYPVTAIEQIGILIADDHKIFRDGLTALLDGAPGMEVRNEAANGIEVLEMLSETDIQVVIMDLKMPEMNGIEATRRIKHKYPNVKVLALSMHDDDEYVVETLKAGAKGYVLKDIGKDELITAILRLSKGKTYFSQEVSEVLMDQVIREHSILPRVEQDLEELLTEREIEVLRLVCVEMTNFEIAEKLGISRRTVDTHRKNLLLKTGAKNIVGLIKFAILNEVIDLLSSD